MQVKGNAHDSTFLSGFSNWKDATRCFHKHELTLTHKAAVEYMVTLPAILEISYHQIMLVKNKQTEY